MKNYVTKEYYTGNNFDTLISSGYDNPNFMTWLQAQKVGRVVKKGSKGIQLVRVIKTTKKNKETGEVETKKRPRYFTVFNFTQTEEIQ